MIKKYTADFRKSGSFLNANKQRDLNKIGIMVQFLLIYRELIQGFVFIFMKNN